MHPAPPTGPGPLPGRAGVDADLELVVGGTRPDDVAWLRAALRTRLEAAQSARTAQPAQSAQSALPPWSAQPGQPALTDPAHGTGPRATPALLVPIGPAEDPQQVRADLARRLGTLPPATGLVLRTSGSTTGTGNLVAMSLRALVASARATHVRLGGPGTWVLALPAHHVAGIQVLVRSLVAGREPVVVETSGGFRPTALADGLERALTQDPDRRVYVSLVPTQLVRVLDDERATGTLARAVAVLLGGAAADPRLLARARRAGVRVVTTYGMSETGGGCVYDGRPLDGVEVWIEDPDEAGEGRIVLAGPVLAEGYAQREVSEPPVPDDAGNRDAGRSQGSRRWGTAAGSSSALVLRRRHGRDQRVLLTSDRGRLDADGRLHVLGRLDDLIVTGGVKISPWEVEEALCSLPGVAEACVVGVPDPQWGSVVVAAVVARVGTVLTSEELRSAARARLDGVHSPKRVLVVDRMPLRGPGKVDRRAVASLAEAETRTRRQAPDADRRGSVGRA